MPMESSGSPVTLLKGRVKSSILACSSGPGRRAQPLLGLEGGIGAFPEGEPGWVGGGAQFRWEVSRQTT